MFGLALHIRVGHWITIKQFFFALCAVELDTDLSFFLLLQHNILIDRKILAQLAVTEPKTFKVRLWQGLKQAGHGRKFAPGDPLIAPGYDQN